MKVKFLIPSLVYDQNVSGIVIYDIYTGKVIYTGSVNEFVPKEFADQTVWTAEFREDVNDESKVVCILSVEYTKGDNDYESKNDSE